MRIAFPVALLLGSSGMVACAEVQEPEPAFAPPVVVVVASSGAAEVELLSLARTWEGTWSSPLGYRCSFVLSLGADEAGHVDGVFAWTLVEAPPSSPQAARIGQTGHEWVRAHIDPRTGTLELVGYRVDRPELLVPDRYRVALGPTGMTFAGHGRGEGDWLDAIHGAATPR